MDSRCRAGLVGAAPTGVGAGSGASPGRSRALARLAPDSTGDVRGTRVAALPVPDRFQGSIPRCSTAFGSRWVSAFSGKAASRTRGIGSSAYVGCAVPT